jgi:predicted CoA-binding protein
MSVKEKVLVIGASPNPSRYSFIATEMLTEYGHEVYPYGIRKGTIGNLPIKLNWPENKQIDTVTMYVGPPLQEQYFENIIKLKPKRVIFNPGTENEQFYALLKENGIAYEEACTLVLLRTRQF